MTRQSKLSLGLDIKPFQKEIKDAKRIVEELANLPIERTIAKAFRSDIARDFKLQTKEIKENIRGINSEMKEMIRSGETASDEFRALGKSLAENHKVLRDSKAIMRSSQGGGGVGKAVGGAVGGATSALGMLGIGVGVSALVQRQLTQAREGMQLRELTGGGIVGGESRYGFTRSERRGRAVEIARGAGRSMSSSELESATTGSEVAQRAFGISGGEYGGAIGASRRAGGGEDAVKFAGDTIGDAVAIGLEGSSVGEYLSSMTGYMESMSKGVDIDQSSLRGFAAAMGQLDFFKSDPSRIFDALRGLGDAFKKSDPYSQYLQYRSIQDAASKDGGGVLSPAAVENRKRLGLFGKVSDKDLLESPDEIRRALSIGSGEMINAYLKNAMKDTQGLGDNEKFLAFQESTNLQPGQALPLFNKFNRGEELSKKDMKAIETAQKSPEERAADNMRSFEGSMLDFGREIDDLANIVSTFASEGVIKFVDAVGGFDNAVGILVAALAGKGLMSAAGGGAFGAAIGGAAGGAVSGATGFLGKGGAVVGAAAAGVLIGEAIRDALNEWTEGAFDKKIQKFWETGLEFMGSDFGGDIADKRRESAEKDKDKYGAGEMVSALRKSEPGRTVSDTDVSRLVRLRKSLSSGDDMAPIEDVLREFGKKDPYADIKMGPKFQFGGPVHRARYMSEGGPIGTDNIPAWLSDGEFVVNARDTGRNRSALEHANNGGLIRPADGGSSLLNNLAAMGNNTGALQNLTLALLKMANKPAALRDVPRGSGAVRYG